MHKLNSHIHDRDEKTEISVGKLFLILEEINKNKKYRYFINELENIFKIPSEISNKFLKKTIADTFDYYKTKKVDYKIFNFNNIIMLLKLNIYILLLYLRSFIYSVKKTKTSLIIDHIEKKDQLQLYDKLVDYFGQSNVIAIVPNNNRFIYKNIKIYNYPINKNYINNYKLFLKIYLFAFKIYFLSKKEKVNYCLLYFRFLESYIYYSNLFSNIESKYTINHQHYHTNAIKNYLYKKNGGECSAVIEKNIHNQGKTGFYYDSDLFFSISKLSSKRAHQYGANFGQVKYIGSFYMENNWFSKKSTDRNNFKNIDIVLLGLVDLWWHDTYNKYKSDYLKQFEWIKKISLKFPNLKIITIYQMGREINKEELKILKNSNIKILIPNNNYSGYGYGLKSRLNLTFGSTIGYEVIGHGSNCFFLDNNSRNQQFLNNEPELEVLKIKSYNQLEEIINKIFVKKIDIFQKIIEENNINVKDFCLKSDNVSHRIYKSLINYQN